MLSKITFQPGINREGTQYSAGPGWYDADKVRFRDGRPEGIGGWNKYKMEVTFPANETGGEVTDTFRGVCRSLYDWGTADAAKYLGIGTNLKFYVETGGVVSDVTPLDTTTSAGDVTFDATSGSSTITVTHTDHGRVAGDYVSFSGAVSLGGLITEAVLNHEHEVETVIDSDNYTIIAKTVGQVEVTANASDTGDGGASVIGYYQINTGTNNYLSSTGYGVGAYGAGPYGGAGTLSFAGQLRLWSQDAFGDDLILCPRGGGIYYWDKSSGTNTRAINIADLPGASDTPVIAKQIMVSPVDRHVIAFGVNPLTSSDLDPLLVRWATQESAADWTPRATNTAGGQVLSSGTSIVGAVKTRHEILIFTDSSITSMRYSGAPFVFQFSVVAENVSILSPRAAISAGDAVYFMDADGFYVYQGAVQQLRCTVLNYVFSALDKTQAYKVFAANNPDDSEVTWFYPAGEPGSEVNRYVTYNYKEGHWTIGTFDRGEWIQAPTKTYPVAATNDVVNVKENFLYNQESGYSADGEDIAPYIESGEVSIGDGESLMFMRRMIPDFRFRGTAANANFDITIKGGNFPLKTPTSRAEVTVDSMTEQNHVRVRAREIVMRIEGRGQGYGWTMGDFRFDMRTDGKR